MKGVNAMIRCLLVLTICAVAVTGFAAPDDDAMAHSKAFERAANARDVKAVLALYAPDARLIWPGQGDEAKGTAEIEKLVTRSLNVLPKDAKFTLKSQDAVPLGNGYIGSVGHWIETFTDSGGKQQTIEIRTTEIIKKEKGKTLYVIDHASVGVPPEPGATGQ
jgi:uncharacterized protein (TIGR02246 family)